MHRLPNPSRRSLLTGLLAAPLAAVAPGAVAELILPGHRLYVAPRDRVAEFLAARKYRGPESFIISVRDDKLASRVQPSDLLPRCQQSLEQLPGDIGVQVEVGDVVGVHCDPQDHGFAEGDHLEAGDEVRLRRVRGWRFRPVALEPLGEFPEPRQADGHDSESFPIDPRRAA